MKKRLFYILLFSILTLSGFAQKEKGLMSRLRLNLEPVYILHESDADEFRGKAKTFKLLTKDVNPNNVYRLFLYGHTFQFEYPISKQDLPNLQELVIYDACYIPDSLSQYSNLQYLIVDNLLTEVCGDCIGKDTNNFTAPLIFPENIYKLNNLKELKYSIYLGYSPSVYISERLFNLNKIRVNLNNDRDFSSLIDVIDYYCYDPIFNLLQDKINNENKDYIKYIEYNKRCITQPHKNGSFTQKNKSGVVIHGNFYKNKAEGEWQIEFPTGCRSTFLENDSLPERDAYTEVRYYKNGLEDSVWSIINAQGDTLRRDYFSNGVCKKVEVIFHETDCVRIEYIDMDNFDDYANRTEYRLIKWSNGSCRKKSTQIKNNYWFRTIDYYKDSVGNETETEEIHDKDSSCLKTIYNKALRESWVEYSNGTKYYKYYNKVGNPHTRNYLQIAKKDTLVVEEFYFPEYIRMEYKQDSLKKNLFCRTICDSIGTVINRDKVKVSSGPYYEPNKLWVGYTCDTVFGSAFQERVLYTVKDLKGNITYQQDKSIKEWPDGHFRYAITEEKFYTITDGKVEIISVYYYFINDSDNIRREFVGKYGSKVDTITREEYSNISWLKPNERNISSIKDSYGN